MKQKPPAPTTGFTLIELMVSLAVAAVLIGLAVPAFNDLVRQRAMISRANDLVLALGYARSEAVRRGGLVSVRAIDADDDDNEWGPGYCVVTVDPDTGDPGDCDSDEVLRTFAGFEDATLDGPDGVEVISYNGRGLPNLAAAASISLCSLDETVDPGRVLNISRTGRVDAEELECHP